MKRRSRNFCNSCGNQVCSAERSHGSKVVANTTSNVPALIAQSYILNFVQPLTSELPSPGPCPACQHQAWHQNGHGPHGQTLDRVVLHSVPRCQMCGKTVAVTPVGVGRTTVLALSGTDCRRATGARSVATQVLHKHAGRPVGRPCSEETERAAAGERKTGKQEAVWCR